MLHAPANRQGRTAVKPILRSGAFRVQRTNVGANGRSLVPGLALLRSDTSPPLQRLKQGVVAAFVFARARLKGGVAPWAPYPSLSAARVDSSAPPMKDRPPLAPLAYGLQWAARPSGQHRAPPCHAELSESGEEGAQLMALPPLAASSCRLDGPLIRFPVAPPRSTPPCVVGLCRVERWSGAWHWVALSAPERAWPWPVAAR